MRHLAAVLVCALVVLGTARQAAHAQFTAPATVPNFETEPFSSSELLRGKRITQPECAALPGAVWVAVDQQGECIRYYHSTAGGSGPGCSLGFQRSRLDERAQGAQALRLLRQAQPGRDAGSKRALVSQSANALYLPRPARR